MLQSPPPSPSPPAANPEIVPYSPEHLPALLRLWTTHFGRWSASRLQRRWQWQFDSNPFNTAPGAHNPVILIGVADDRVVGHISGIPIPMRCAGQLTTVLAASGLVTDPAHRWLGFRLVRALMSSGPVLATAMSDAAFKLISQCGATPLPIARRQHILPRRYGGLLASKLRARLPPSLASAVPVSACSTLAPWYVPTDKPKPRRLPPRSPHGLTIRPITRFDSDYDALWTRSSSPLRWTVERSASYLNWRYLDCPTLHPVCLGAYDADNHLAAVAVGVRRARLGRGQVPCETIGEIVEVIAPDLRSHAAAAVLSHLIHRLDGPSIDAVCASWLHADLHPTFESMGFCVEHSDEFNAALRSVPSLPSSDAAPGSADWFYTAGDGDSIFTTAI